MESVSLYAASFKSTDHCRILSRTETLCKQYMEKDWNSQLSFNTSPRRAEFSSLIGQMCVAVKNRSSALKWLKLCVCLLYWTFVCVPITGNTGYHRGHSWWWNGVLFLKRDIYCTSGIFTFSCSYLVSCRTLIYWMHGSSCVFMVSLN